MSAGIRFGRREAGRRFIGREDSADGTRSFVVRLRRFVVVVHWQARRDTRVWDVPTVLARARAALGEDTSDGSASTPGGETP